MQDGLTVMREKFLGQQVQLFPGDTNSKFATVEEINAAGVTFLVTKSKCSMYPVGVHFVSFHGKLHFKLVVPTVEHKGVLTV